ncbi:hypothetical protein AAMO2058_000293800 [Amorphochlora amoebiformis]
MNDPQLGAPEGMNPVTYNKIKSTMMQAYGFPGWMGGELEVAVLPIYDKVYFEWGRMSPNYEYSQGWCKVGSKAIDHRERKTGRVKRTAHSNGFGKQLFYIEQTRNIVPEQIASVVSVELWQDIFDDLQNSLDNQLKGKTECWKCCFWSLGGPCCGQCPPLFCIIPNSRIESTVIKVVERRQAAFEEVGVDILVSDPRWHNAVANESWNYGGSFAKNGWFMKSKPVINLHFKKKGNKEKNEEKNKSMEPPKVAEGTPSAPDGSDLMIGETNPN